MEIQRLCTEFGAAHILDLRGLYFASHVHELTEGIGAGVMFGAVGMEKAFLGVILACCAQGTIADMAGWRKDTRHAC